MAAVTCSLANVTDKGLPQVVVDSAEAIFKLNDTAVRDEFNSKSVSALKDTRDAMLTKFAEICPKYPANAAHARKNSKAKIIQDIIILGSCIVSKGPVENMDRIYQIQEQTPEFDLDQSDQSKAIKYLLQLTKAMSLELGELRSVKEENIELKDKVAILEAQIVDLNAAANIQQNSIVPSEPGNEQVNGDDPDLIDDNIDQDEPEQQPRQVVGAVRTAEAFIGQVLAPCSAYDIQNHIKKNTSVNPKMSDIREIKVRGRNKAFRVTVPKNKLNEVIAESVWGSDITAEKYDPHRPKTFNQPRGAKTNSHKTQNRDQSFRNQNRKPQSYQRTSYQGNARSPNQHYQTRYSRDQYRPQY